LGIEACGVGCFFSPPFEKKPKTSGQWVLDRAYPAGTMTHKRNVLWGILFGLVFWFLTNLGLICYEQLYFTSVVDVSDGLLGRPADKGVRYENTIFAEIRAEKASEAMGGGGVGEQLLREDAVGPHSEWEIWDRDGTYTGRASWYGYPFDGRRTASGEVFDKNLFTCASVRHSFGTLLRVCNLQNGRCVTVKVNDTGAFESLGRVIDLSEAAFAEIADLGRGVVRVRIEEEK